MKKNEEIQLFKALLELKNTDECKKFFRDLCTPTELEELAARWRVARLLTKKISYRQIAEETGVSTTTVGRVARCLKYGCNGYTTILSRLRSI
ncbi:MAG: YerC/YecD family TrpR-related protein [Pseudomonadota bacterium]|nr:YerC/YecD family TrpR-related protein [Pseudomonadota bacterium]